MALFFRNYILKGKITKNVKYFRYMYIVVWANIMKGKLIFFTQNNIFECAIFVISCVYSIKHKVFVDSKFWGKKKVLSISLKLWLKEKRKQKIGYHESITITMSHKGSLRFHLQIQTIFTMGIFSFTQL